MKWFLSVLILLLNFSLTTHAQTMSSRDVTMEPSELANKAYNFRVKPFLDAESIPGAAVAIYIRGKTYYFNYGVANRARRTPVTENTIFELASITKVFTTTLLGVALEKKQLTLSDPISKYMSGMAAKPAEPIASVTVQELATHTAGFPRDVTDFGVRVGDNAGLMQSLRAWQPERAIGKTYLYSNVSFGLLGKVVEGATKKTYADLLATEVTGPLNMTHTFITVPANKTRFVAQGYRKNGSPAPFYVPHQLLGGGALRSSAKDLMQFLILNINSAATPQKVLLSKALYRIQQPYFTVRPNFVMGLGWQRITRQNHLFITKNGGNQGFSTFIGFAPKEQIGVVVLFNQSKKQAGRIGNQLLNELVAPSNQNEDAS